MASASVALLGISNAIVDVLSQVQPADIEQIGAPPGSMTLIDQEKAVSLYASMQNKVESAGGSVANSVACFASLGGSAAYIGRVAEDELGNAFDADMRKLTIDMRLPPETRAAPTARSHIMITPNGERTMQTFLGACTEIAVSDMTEHTIGTPDVILLEGYVWDTPEGPAAMARAIELGKLAGARIALSLSDSFCVERHESAFTTLASGDADIIIGNEAEMLALFGVNTYSDAIAAAGKNGRLFVMTRSGEGSVIIHGQEVVIQPADQIDNLIDTTGAGDAYVAGFLYGFTHGMTLSESALLGTRSASLAIQQVGARPLPADLRHLL